MFGLKKENCQLQVKFNACRIIEKYEECNGDIHSFCFSTEEVSFLWQTCFKKLKLFVEAEI